VHLILSARDQILARYGNQLAALGDSQARKALSRALNHEGDKGRTQVKRALVKQTGIKYGAVNKAMATIRATAATLTYTLKARGDETNNAWFGGVQRRKGVSAAPWHKRRIFRHSFIVPRFGRAFIRTPKSGLPIWPFGCSAAANRRCCCTASSASTKTRRCGRPAISAICASRSTRWFGRLGCGIEMTGLRGMRRVA
jgi:hypothetical protein